MTNDNENRKIMNTTYRLNTGTQIKVTASKSKCNTKTNMTVVNAKTQQKPLANRG